jgi:hypothetical protein
MPHRKNYSTKLRIIMPIEVRADTDQHAAQLIDAVIKRMGDIVVYDGTPDCHDYSLHGIAERIERDDVQLNLF